MAVDLLTKTGPISGAVRARKMERLQAEAEAFTSLPTVTTGWQPSVCCPMLKSELGSRMKRNEEGWGVVKVVLVDHMRERREQQTHDG